jgi:subtilase family serine protease
MRRGQKRLAGAVRTTMESLEERCLLSATLINGQLNITGTSGPDKIVVKLTGASASNIRVRGLGGGLVFPVAEVQQININGEAGNDSITLSDVNGVIPVPARIIGGAGNDTIIGSASGNDTLIGNQGKDYLQGEAPGDVLRGNRGPDTLVGGSGGNEKVGPGNNLVSTNDGSAFTFQSSSPLATIGLPANSDQTTMQLYYQELNSPSAEGVNNPFVVGYTPQQVRTAYSFGALSSPTTTDLGQGQTIAIVDPFDSTTVFNDLTTFSEQFGLPLPTAQSFEKVYATGQQPAVDPDADVEIDLDVEWAHAMAPDAKIVLVEAASLLPSDLFVAVQYAARQVASDGGGAVSMSFGSTGETYSDYVFDQIFESYPSVSFVASSGDILGVDSYPAMSPYVTSVGGTTLFLNSLGVRTSAELPWSQTGGGASALEPQPVYQQILGTPATTANGATTIAARVGPDVAFLADPNTGVAVYNSSPNPLGDSGWQVVGGTSLSAPMFAATVALIDQARNAGGQPVIGGNLNNAIYLLNTYFSGRDFTAISGGYNTQTGWGTPIVSNLIADMSLLSLNGTTPPAYDAYADLTNVKLAATSYADFSTPVSGVTPVSDSYLGTGSIVNAGPSALLLSVTAYDAGGNATTVTADLALDLTNDTFTGLDTTGIAAQTGTTIYVTGSFAIGPQGISQISGDFYSVTVNADGTYTPIGKAGVGGLGGDVEGTFSS